MKGFPKDIISKFDSYKYTDERGFNAINFEDFKNNISYKESFSKKNVFRGMHVQLPPFAQSKYIQVSNGSIIDFIIPLDSSRNDFGNLYHFEISSAESIYYIPPYCAHGFYAIEDTTFKYICLGDYNEKNEISIKPPKFVTENFAEIILSKKDENGMNIEKALENCKKINWTE
tara:strand:+ start:1031 stop:1549 length:519 start_codon:yes stop_codon:yes gene_type:complete